MATTINGARTLIVNFTRESLAGEVPPAMADDDDFYAVGEALTRDSTFFAHAVSNWPPSQRRALFEMLAAAIVQLRTRAPEVFDAEVFDGCTCTAVAAGFGRWLATLHACVRDVQRARRRRYARRAARSWTGGLVEAAAV